MTPQARDRNLARVRRLTAFVAGAAVTATGIFAGLASNATGHSAATTTTTTRQTQRKAKTQTPATQAPAAQAPSIVVTPSSSPPVSNSGGS
ncbi:MAG TPA: hypothetical protein VKR23_03945 [Gaiellaceae bacterium]|nr:hypothetical protein [Gaiellaceae bacterium]